MKKKIFKHKKKMLEDSDKLACDNKKSKMTIFLIILSFSFLVIAGVCGYFGYNHYKNYLLPPIPLVKEVSIDKENKMLVKFNVPKENKYNKVYCLFKNDDKAPSVSDKQWFLSKNNECTYLLTSDAVYAYLKNEKGVIYDVKIHLH